MLRDIVAGSSTIQERLAPSFRPGAAERPRARELLNRWQRKISPSGPHGFEKRLGWLGSTPGEMLAYLGEGEIEGPLPSWSAYLEEALSRFHAEGPATESDHPFGMLVAPFAHIGRERITPACEPVFSAKAIDQLVGDLMGALSHLAAPVFFLLFTRKRSEAGFTRDPSSRVLLDRFIGDMHAGGLEATFLEYPVLGRLLSTLLEDWIANTINMANALARDHRELSAVFAEGRPLGRAEGLQLSLSDRHNGGNTVSILRFEDGTRIVYKPRDVSIEQAWFDLLSKLNDSGGEFLLLKTLPKGTYGWVEAANPAPCTTQEEVHLYYRRAGMLLCVLYALEASDCFFENILACGAYPVLIDMETLMHTVFRKEADMSPAEEMADDVIFNSVFRAGFLPSWETGPTGHCVDISGLGAVPGQVTSYVQREWSDLNSDAIALARKPILVDTNDHLPSLLGAPVAGADHVDHVVEGFQTLYRIFQADKDALTNKQGPLSALSACEIRLVFHATRIYGLVLKRLGAPRHMKSGVERSIETDIFSRFYLEARRKDRFRAILEAEIQSLDRLDVPKFTIRADSRSLSLPTGVILEDIFEEPAIDRVFRRIGSFGDADMRLQSDFIKASLRLANATVSHQPVCDEAAASPEAAPNCSAADLIREAEEIAASLEERAILSPDGSATWIAAQLLPGTSRYELRPLRMDLYNGLAGVALFFAALNRVAGHGRGTAFAALRPLRRYLRVSSPEAMVRDGYTLGAATGMGSFVSTLAWCGDLLGATGITDEAIAAAAKITPDWIRDDDSYDLMSGSAGAILGLLCVFDRTHNRTVLDIATACGEHLIANAKPAKSGVAWETMAGGTCLTGLSHGNAGIAASLRRLAAAGNRQDFADMAAEAIRYENALFDPVRKNWPDLRAGPAEPAKYMNTWCHGAPGIGLARTMMAKAGQSPTLTDDIHAARVSTGQAGIGSRDGLCCGALGRSELFLQTDLADHGGRPDQAALSLASQVIARKRQAGSFRLTDRKASEFFDPSFFQGVSGIGYQLLRIARPDLLPSVLTWE